MKTKLIFGLALLICPTFLFSQIIYVNQKAISGNNNGTSWEDAYLDLQDALMDAPASSEVWIAEGIYFPSQNADKRRSFSLNKEIHLYGGFEGNESTLEQRDLNFNETVLSADYDQNDEVLLQSNFISIANNKENANNVLFTEGVSGEISLDGITIEGGFADEVFVNGGGFLIRGEGSLELTIRNCKFLNNQGRQGGAIFMVVREESSIRAIIENCEFQNNRAFQGDSAKGGAVWIVGNGPADTKFINTKFIENYSAGRGGAVSSDDLVKVNYIGCLFDQNIAENGGATFSNNGFEELSFTNCTFYKNWASERGSAIVKWGDFGNEDVTLNNCIFSNNEIENVSMLHHTNTIKGGFAISNSLIQEIDFNQILITALGSADLGGNIFEQEPGFLDAENGNLNIGNFSTAYNKGNNDFVLTLFDINGKPRIADGIVDLGCYEYNMPVATKTVSTSAISVGPNPFLSQLSINLDEDKFQLNNIGSIEIYTLTGQLIFTQNVQLEKRITLELSHLSAAFYLLKLTTKDGDFIERILKI